MKITSVEPQKKNPRRFNIFLDGKFGFGADEDTIVRFRLVPQKEIDSPTLEKILYELEIGKLMERMYGQFSVRMRSEKEIRDYLKRLSFKRKLRDQEEISELIADLLVERLKEKKLIEDAKFAKDWVMARRISKNKGKIALKMELFQKGIDSSIVDESLETTPEDEEKLALRALEKKIRLWRNLAGLALKKKAIEFLMRKGFEYDLSLKVIDKLLKIR